MGQALTTTVTATASVARALSQPFVLQLIDTSGASAPLSTTVQPGGSGTVSLPMASPGLALVVVATLDNTIVATWPQAYTPTNVATVVFNTNAAGSLIAAQVMPHN
jgi:hypothetical protein